MKTQESGLNHAKYNIVREDAHQNVALKIAPHRFPLSIKVPWYAVIIASIRGAKKPINKMVRTSTGPVIPD